MPRLLFALFYLIVFVAFPFQKAGAQPLSLTDSLSIQAKSPALKEFAGYKFGMFITWGLYAQVGYNEWAYDRGQIPMKKYEKLAKTFQPNAFNAKEWATLASNTGMKYLVFVSKHHDGYQLFPSAYSEWNLQKASGFKRDVLKELANELKAKNIQLGIYYSILDWHHPDYKLKRKWTPSNFKAINWENYLKYMDNHLAELDAAYKPILYWFDGDWERQVSKREALALGQNMLKRNPSILFNDRLFLRGSSIGHIRSPENEIPERGYRKKDGTPEVWEACFTISPDESWGYNPYSQVYYSGRDLIRILSEIVSKGGNLLLNVGPKPDGSIQTEFKERLAYMGQWVKANEEAIYNTEEGAFYPTAFYGRTSQKDKDLYVHLYIRPELGYIELPKHLGKIEKANFLVNKRGLSVQEFPYFYRISLPDSLPDADVSIIKISYAKRPLLKEPFFAANLWGEPKELITLQAAMAHKEGTRKTDLVTTQYYQQAFVQKWEDSTTYLKWSLNNIKPGKYRVKVFNTLHWSNNFTGMEVTLGKQVLKTISGPLQYEYFATPKELGVLDIPAGVSELSFRLCSPLGIRAFRVEKIILERLD